MFERFTDRARRVVVLAQQEARLLGHDYIGTEHLLLGLIHESEGVAAKVLDALGISLESVREKVESIVGPGEGAPTGHIPFTPRSKKVLELSLREALQLGHNYIGTEHILLGLVREGEGLAAQILVTMGAELSTVRHSVIQRMSGYSIQRTSMGVSPAFGPPRQTPAVAKAGMEARRLAGSGPVGSHHQLLALLGQTDSVAAKALESLGVSKESLEAKLATLDTAGTSDETPEEAGARRIRMRVEGKLLTLEIDDPTLAEALEKAMIGRRARLISGSDPEAEGAGFANLWSAVSQTVDGLSRQVGRMSRAKLGRPPTAEWRPPGWHEHGHAAVYWMVSTVDGRSGHLQVSEAEDAPAVRTWLREWLVANRPTLAGADRERRSYSVLWAYVDRADDSFTMTSFGYGDDGPPGREPVSLDVLAGYAVDDLG